jgi:prepilin-type processing-associated H-X9-DG protein
MRNVIQLLILALIGLTCGGLFTSFIVQVREAARRSQCWNNLRSIGIATVNYADSFHGTFPQAGELNPRSPRPVEPPEKRLSWLVAIFPYLEANTLYNDLSHDKTWDAEENRFAALTDCRIFQCPGYPDRPPASTLVSTHYVGITGIGADAITLPLDDPRAGILGYDRKVTEKDLSRGSSETVLVVETSQASGAWTAAGPPTARGLEPRGSAYFGGQGQFGGNHRGGANAGFADGSVRFIEQSIDPAVWEAMATLSGKGNRE